MKIKIEDIKLNRDHLSDLDASNHSLQAKNIIANANPNLYGVIFYPNISSCDEQSAITIDLDMSTINKTPVVAWRTGNNIPIIPECVNSGLSRYCETSFAMYDSAMGTYTTRNGEVLTDDNEYKLWAMAAIFAEAKTPEEVERQEELQEFILEIAAEMDRLEMILYQYRISDTKFDIGQFDIDLVELVKMKASLHMDHVDGLESSDLNVERWFGRWGKKLNHRLERAKLKLKYKHS